VPLGIRLKRLPRKDSFLQSLGLIKPLCLVRRGLFVSTNIEVPFVKEQRSLKK